MCSESLSSVEEKESFPYQLSGEEGVVVGGSRDDERDHVHSTGCLAHKKTHNP